MGDHLRDDLVRSVAYDPPAPSVGLVETHISWVFLLEHDVFKVKRPVNLGFLDFRTLEARRIACDAEVRLNGRLAPGVYLGVVPITRGPDGRGVVGGGGEVVDWAVHMRRLPDERRADMLLQAGQLSGERIDSIARRLVEFHGAAAGGAEIGAFGTRDRLAVNVEENFAQTTGLLERILSREEQGDIVSAQRTFLRDHQALFAARIAAGRVKDGHGDLRLEHVYLYDDAPPTILDCIEFNERFRFADVCCDVAFLSMDLASHGRVDLAERLLARYAREANDFDLYALVDFYEAYRAYVRGKISAMLAADDGAGLPARAAAEAAARRHFLLALSAQRRSLLPPALVAVGGVIASGKSTIAEHAAGLAIAPIVDADRTRKSMLHVDATQHVNDTAWHGAYDPGFTETVYAEVLRRAGVVLASGRPVVIDASFRSRHMRAAALALARQHHVPFLFVECRADTAVCRARLEERARHAAVSDGRLEVFDAFVARFEKVDELPVGDHLVLDTARPLEDSVAALRAHIATWPPGLPG